MTNATGCSDAPTTDPCVRCDTLLGIPDLHVEAVERTDALVTVTVSTPWQLMGCPSCGVVAPSRGRRRRELTVLACRNATLHDFQAVVADLREDGGASVVDWVSHRIALEDAPAALAQWTSDPTGLVKAVIMNDAGGFIEPLESTAIHLVQTAITKLFWLFPDSGFDPVLRAEFNKLMIEQYEYIRDFVMLHYYANQRDDPFWREMASMPIPDSLAHKLELFRGGGRIRRYDHDLFGVQSWAAVMLGQNVQPSGYDPLVDSMDQAKVTAAMQQIADTYRGIGERAPDHAQALDNFCKGLPRPAVQG